jgi:hypothetical protein
MSFHNNEVHSLPNEKKETTMKNNSFLRITNSFILKSTILNITTEEHLDGHYIKVEQIDHQNQNNPTKTVTQTYRVKSQYINDVLDYIHQCLNSDIFQPWNQNWTPDPRQKRTVKRKLALVVASDT